MGRPHEYSEALTEALCERLAQGRSLTSICGDEDMPASSTVFRGLARRPDFVRAYAAARDIQAHALFDQLLAIADAAPDSAGGVAKARLMVDTRKWWLARVAPKVYGDRLDLTPETAAMAMTQDERQARIRTLLETSGWTPPGA